ncbi:hypothetical protein Ocin01_09339, partial [Orchesella cincta]
MNVSNICIDGAVNIPGHFDATNKQQVFSGDELDTIIVECGPALAEEETDHPTLLYGIALFISSLFLVAIIVVYGLLWDKQNVHGLTMLGYVITMLGYYMALLATFIYLYAYPNPNYVNETEIFSSFCGIIAYWNKVKEQSQIHHLPYFHRRSSIHYCGNCSITGSSYGDELEENIVLPRYGWNKCFMDLEYAALPYYFAPAGSLLILNCILYFTTIFHIHKLQESTKFASATSSSSQVQKQRAKTAFHNVLI